jgi:hypothetical protein
MVRYYTHRFGLIWNAAGNPRTASVASADAATLAGLAIDTPHDSLSEAYLAQLSDLVSAVREARKYEAAEMKDAA